MITIYRLIDTNEKNFLYTNRDYFSPNIGKNNLLKQMELEKGSLKFFK